MSRFRKKPVEVEAIRWDGSNRHDVFDFLVKCHAGEFSIPDTDAADQAVEVETGHGLARAQVGAWLVVDSNEMAYPVESGIFRETYEAS